MTNRRPLAVSVVPFFCQCLLGKSIVTIKVGKNTFLSRRFGLSGPREAELSRRECVLFPTLIVTIDLPKRHWQYITDDKAVRLIKQNTKLVQLTKDCTCTNEVHLSIVLVDMYTCM